MWAISLLSVLKTYAIWTRDDCTSTPTSQIDQNPSVRVLTTRYLPPLTPSLPLCSLTKQEKPLSPQGCEMHFPRADFMFPFRFSRKQQIKVNYHYWDVFQTSWLTSCFTIRIILFVVSSTSSKSTLFRSTNALTTCNSFLFSKKNIFSSCWNAGVFYKVYGLYSSVNICRQLVNYEIKFLDCSVVKTENLANTSEDRNIGAVPICLEGKFLDLIVFLLLYKCSEPTDKKPRQLVSIPQNNIVIQAGVYFN